MAWQECLETIRLIHGDGEAREMDDVLRSAAGMTNSE